MNFFWPLFVLQCAVCLDPQNAIHLRDAIRGISTELHLIASIVDDYIRKTGGKSFEHENPRRSHHFDHTVVEDIVKRTSKKQSSSMNEDDAPPNTRPGSDDSFHRIISRISYYLQIVIWILSEVILMVLDVGLLSMCNQAFLNIQQQSHQGVNAATAGRARNPLISLTSEDKSLRFTPRFPTSLELLIALLSSILIRLIDFSPLVWTLRAVLIVLGFWTYRGPPTPSPASRASSPLPTFGNDMNAYINSSTQRNS